MYAFGDIHGRADLLGRLHTSVRDDASRAPEPRRIAIYLGDYLDRGENSRGVLDMLPAGPGPGFETVHLCGNHEDFLLRFLEDSGLAEIWLQNGAAATLQSYGIDAHLPQTEIRSRLAAALPESHVAFLKGLRRSASVGDYFFVHAGVRPGVALDRQDPRDLMWIRDEFLQSDEDFGKTIVYGHTPRDTVAFEDTRIGIDTMAWASGRLTCLVLAGREQRLLQT
ncbi:MAG: metallophosphoesterase [Proteobacteria bacterium]|nr:metallophosphoesterase [Pseudomonadota bacterium]MDA1132372.1 metallophosphoesterase [Pseudomonadota bacterium]